MHEFKYKRNELYCELQKVEDIAKKIPTPFYLYSAQTILDHLHKLKNAFREIDPLICFSMKSNSNLSIVKSLLRKGSGLDIVSGGELYKAKLLKANPKKIVYASVGKTEKEIKDAINYGILLFNVESESELELINRTANALGKKTEVCLRVNPHISPLTHHYIKTAEEESKFGLDLDTAESLFLRRRDFSHINIVGLHLHIGSQITEAKPYIQAIKKVSSLLKRLKDYNIPLKYLNIGGGLGIIYKEERPQTAKEFARNILPLLKPLGLKIILEPGRFIVGNAGILVTKVIYIKDTPKKRFVIVDAGMNDLIRPALYNAYHEILPVNRLGGYSVIRSKCDIVGPVCESADFLGKDRDLPDLKAGDFLAVFGCGAYGFSMSSNYNSRPRIAEVIVKKDKFYLIRERENYRDLIKKEIMLKNL